MKNILYSLIVSILLLSSCTSIKQLRLIGDMVQEEVQAVYPEFVIGVGDELVIKIKALDADAVEPFNTESSYVVDIDGMIEMPILGKIELAGKTLEEAKSLIASLLSDKVQNTYVMMSFPNSSISVLGEVVWPHELSISRPITILEAISAAYGMTNNARRTEVEVLRFENNQVHKYVLDLTSPNLFQSSGYYLVKGDIVNVRPLHSVILKN